MPLADLPQTNRQHPVPQNIMDVEFKLIGDLTMRQFAYLLIFGLSAYFSYLIVIGIFKWPIVITLALLGIGLAFVPVEERGLDEWIVNFFKAINSPTQRIWKKEPQIPSAFLYDNIAVVKQEMITLAPTSSRRKLEEYLKYQKDSDVVDVLDIPEKEYILKVKRAYPSISTSQPVLTAPTLVSEPSVGVALEEPLVEVPVKEEEPEQVEKQPEEKSEEGKEVKEESKLETKEVLKRKPVGQREQLPHIMSIRRNIQKAKQIIMPNVINIRKEEMSYEPITPDMHSGRKFVNLVPSEVELILPIRGERVIKTSDEIENEEDLKEKTSQLKDLLSKIREEEGLSEVPTVQALKEVSEVGVKKQASSVVEKLEQQNEELSREIEKLQSQINRGKSMSLETETQEQLLKRLESQKEKIASSYTELRRQVQDLQKKLEEKTNVSTGPEYLAKAQGQIPVMTDKPNVVTGVVRGSDGKFLSDILLIIKNTRGEAVRAFKTNSLGQFIATTPLQNGAYTIEVSPVNKTTLTFDIIPIEVKGEVIPPLEISGR
ncbi:MAG: PrgI family protein [Patescibacteria group bacterium]